MLADKAGYCASLAVLVQEGTPELTSAQKLRCMNSLGISSAATSDRLCSIRASLEPASFSPNAFPAAAMSSRIKDTDEEAMIV